MVCRHQTMVWRHQTIVCREQTIAETARRILRSAEKARWMRVRFFEKGGVRLSGLERITDGKVEDETVTEFVDVIKARLARSIGRVESDAEVETEHQVA